MGINKEQLRVSKNTFCWLFFQEENGYKVSAGLSGNCWLGVGNTTCGGEPDTSGQGCLLKSKRPVEGCWEPELGDGGMGTQQRANMRAQTKNVLGRGKAKLESSTLIFIRCVCACVFFSDYNNKSCSM